VTNPAAPTPPAPTSGRRRYQVFITDEQIARFRELSRLTGVPVRALASEAFAEYLDKYEPLAQPERINAERRRAERERTAARSAPFSKPRRMAPPKQKTVEDYRNEE
jgi:hypothetical protein